MSLIDPFKVHITYAALTDLKHRLAHTRWPDDLSDAGWDYGIPLSVVQELVAAWRDQFDWREQEAKLNRWDHFTTTLEGRKLHFVHQRSREPRARPLVLLHGWPGSFHEFHRTIDRLTDPVAHGGRAEDAFHVVCPSLPGFGFSEAPRSRGFGVQRMARTIASLMARLGYEGYMAQGGDFGAHVARFLAYDDPHCLSIHLNMVVAFPPDSPNPTAGLSGQELRDLAAGEELLKSEMGYFHQQTTKPQSLGYGLTDSPAGLAAWLAEKYMSVEFGIPEIDRDELLTQLSIYWFTGCITSSMRLYKEAFVPGELLPPWQRVKVPTACLIAPREAVRFPRDWAEKIYNVNRWTRLERGGHFLALEEPEALVNDLRATNAFTRKPIRETAAWNGLFD